MNQSEKRNNKTATRAAKLPAQEQRKRKLITALDEQVLVVKAAVSGDTYGVMHKVWANNEVGEKVLVDKTRKVRTCFMNS